IPGPRRLVAGPGGLLHAGEHHALVGIGGLLVGPDIPVAVGRVRRASCVAKPGMRIRGVVDDEIDDDTDAALPATMGEFDEIPERAVAWIDTVIIRDVVTIVLAGRRLERHQPERGNAKPLQIVQPPHQTLEIADAVAVGVHIGADGEAIYYAVLVPEIIDHAEAAFLVRTRFKAATYKRREFTGFPRAAGVPGDRPSQLDRQKPVSPGSTALYACRHGISPPCRPGAAAGPPPVGDRAGDRARHRAVVAVVGVFLHQRIAAAVGTPRRFGRTERTRRDLDRRNQIIGRGF